jgi:hypothetical protein
MAPAIPSIDAILGAIDCALAVARVPMNTKALLEKLIEVERALAYGHYAAARALVLEAEDSLLQIEREMIRMQTDKVRRSA